MKKKITTGVIILMVILSLGATKHEVVKTTVTTETIQFAKSKKVVKKNKRKVKTKKRTNKKSYRKYSKKYSSKRVYKSSSNYSVSELQAYARELVLNVYGWSEADFNALVALWNKESGWNANAHNKRSGAHGIPQALPAKKMKSEGSDYYTNGKTQIRWGLKYISGRYGTPTKALQHSKKKGWY